MVEILLRNVRQKLIERKALLRDRLERHFAISKRQVDRGVLLQPGFPCKRLGNPDGKPISPSLHASSA